MFYTSVGTLNVVEGNIAVRTKVECLEKNFWPNILKEFLQGCDICQDDGNWGSQRESFKSGSSRTISAQFLDQLTPKTLIKQKTYGLLSKTHFRRKYCRFNRSRISSRRFALSNLPSPYPTLGAPITSYNDESGDVMHSGDAENNNEEVSFYLNIASYLLLF